LRGPEGALNHCGPRLQRRFYCQWFPPHPPPPTPQRIERARSKKKRGRDDGPEIKAETIKERKAALEDENRKDSVIPDIFHSRRTTLQLRISAPPAERRFGWVLLTWQTLDWGQEAPTTGPRRLMPKLQAKLSIRQWKDQVLQEVGSNICGGSGGSKGELLTAARPHETRKPKHFETRDAIRTQTLC